MTVPVEETETRVEGNANGAVPGMIRLRWVTVAEAARLLSISDVAVRKRLADGSLTGVRAGRGWKVLLAGEPDWTQPKAADEEAPREHESGRRDGDAETLLAQTVEALNALVRDLQRQSLALAAQVGYLQSQLADAQSQVKLLAERNEATVEHEPGGPSRAEYEAAQQTIGALRAALAAAREPETVPRRGWRFWRRD